MTVRHPVCHAALLRLHDRVAGERDQLQASMLADVDRGVPVGVACWNDLDRLDAELASITANIERAKEGIA